MELKAQRRSVTGKGVQALRKEGKVPAVVYGTKQESFPIEMSSKDFGRVFKEAGESTMIELVIDGEKKSALIHDIDRDPVTDEVRHADFYAIQKGQKVEVAVPIIFSGEAPAVKELGANIIKVLHEIEVEGEASRLPHTVSVDVSALVTLESYISAKDIALPDDVRLITAPDEMVATVALPEEEPEEPVATPDMESIGISEERGKKEDEGSEGTASTEKTEA